MKLPTLAPNPGGLNQTVLVKDQFHDAVKQSSGTLQNWRYLEFRQNDIETLRDKLTDKDSIETYKTDPFNPHAIARLSLGLSAYKKAIVMKYIDNLLDWGDHLFAQDTMESINEATLLYVLAADILGDRL